MLWLQLKILTQNQIQKFALAKICVHGQLSIINHLEFELKINVRKCNSVILNIGSSTAMLNHKSDAKSGSYVKECTEKVKLVAEKSEFDCLGYRTESINDAKLKHSVHINEFDKSFVRIGQICDS